MEQYHPVINFIYFGLVIGCSMVFLHPICLIISITGAVCYAVNIFGWRSAVKGLTGVSGLMILTALINPTFSHQGVTELMELPSGNMLTLESILFGIGAAFMLGATLIWFRILGEILTADKIVYLFGKAFPVLGLLLSMILGFLPKVKRKYSEISACRKYTDNSYERRENDDGTVRRKMDAGSYVRRIISKMRHETANLSILITWMLEDSVEMAQSMRGRGYGLEGRTNFTIYRFTGRDRKMLVFLLVSAGYIIYGSIRGALLWDYYPVTGGAAFSPYSVSVYIAYAMLCMAPFVEEVRRGRMYRRLMNV